MKNLKATEKPALKVLKTVDQAVRAALESRGGEPRRAAAETDSLARRLIRTILTRRATLDWLIDRFRRGRVRPRVRRVLWWALAESLYLDGLPPPVVVDTAVDFLKRKSAAEARFANALLRRILDMGREQAFSLIGSEAPPEVRLDLGVELYNLWSSRFDGPELERLGRLVATPPAVVVRLRPGFSAAEFDGLSALPAPDWAPESRLFHCLDAQALFSSPGWRQGGGYIQDPSTLLAASLLGVRRGERVADLCAAPGGKALLLLEALDGEGHLVCMDRSAARLPRLCENLGRQAGWSAVVADAARPPLTRGGFDAVLMDVPCSNTGVVRRRPDVRWHVSRDHIRETAALQSRILLGGGAAVRRGGRLVYSTCSIEPEENESVVREFLARCEGHFHLGRERTLLPQEWHDGAYAALLIKA